MSGSRPLSMWFRRSLSTSKAKKSPSHFISSRSSLFSALPAASNSLFVKIKRAECLPVKQFSGGSTSIMRLQKFGVLLLAAASSFVLGADKSQTFTGEVSDSMCGAAHMMPGKTGDCARACVGKGSSYALVVGEKVYSL